MSLVRIVGLGPGDPDLLTLGSLESLRAVGRAVTVLAPPELVLFLESEGIRYCGTASPTRGSSCAASRDDRRLRRRRRRRTRLALGVLGNPLSDFPGLPILLRALERRRVACELVPGMPRATLSAAIAMPLLPLPPASAHQPGTTWSKIMARLRRGCPWDREQTHRSLLPYLIEETYEVVEAVEGNGDAELCEELGDLLLQIVFHAQLATERGKFSVANVIDELANKMIRRHPHVFGDQAVSTVAEVWANWDQLKSQEAAARSRASRLDGIPKGLGALQRAQKMQEKAGRVGFDWPTVDGIRDKLAEELAELEAARRDHDEDRVREEAGDVIFTVVNFARALGVTQRVRCGARTRSSPPLHLHGTTGATGRAVARRHDARRIGGALATREDPGGITLVCA